MSWSRSWRCHCGCRRRSRCRRSRAPNTSASSARRCVRCCWVRANLKRICCPSVAAASGVPGPSPTVYPFTVWACARLGSSRTAARTGASQSPPAREREPDAPLRGRMVPKSSRAREPDGRLDPARRGLDPPPPPPRRRRARRKARTAPASRPRTRRCAAWWAPQRDRTHSSSSSSLVPPYSPRHRGRPGPPAPRRGNRGAGDSERPGQPGETRRRMRAPRPRRIGPSRRRRARRRPVRRRSCPQRSSQPRSPPSRHAGRRPVRLSRRRRPCDEGGGVAVEDGPRQPV